MKSQTWLLVVLMGIGTWGCATESGPTNADSTPPKARHGIYLGETPPGTTPQMFAPGLVSTGLSTRDMAISADGNEIYFTLMGQGTGTMIALRRSATSDGDVWSAPTVVGFSGIHNDIEPSLHPNGRQLFFASTRPLPGEEQPGDWNIWMSERNGESWGEPTPLPINSDVNEIYPSLTADGTIYFTAARPDSFGREDLYRSRLRDGVYLEPENLGPEINSTNDEFNAWVAPDESMLIFGSVREGDFGGGDLYVSFRESGDAWDEATNLGDRINSARLDYCPFVTADGKYLFFTSNRTGPGDKHPIPRDYKTLIETLQGPLNGADSIYWVDATFMDSLHR